MNKKLLALVAGATLVLSLGACGTKEENTSSNSNSNQTASSGADPDKVFQQSCASCHGNNLQGQVGPGLQKVGNKYSQEEIEKIILKGRGSMPAGIVEGEDATKLAEWLSQKK